MPYSVFIRYRREGGGVFARMFSEKLSKKQYEVFYDIESIGVGASINRSQAPHTGTSLPRPKDTKQHKAVLLH